MRSGVEMVFAMIRISAVLLLLSATLLLPTFAAQHDKAECTARPLVAPAEAKAETALACRDHISLVSYRPYRRLRSKGVHLCAKAADVRLDYRCLA